MNRTLNPFEPQDGELDALVADNPIEEFVPASMDINEPYEEKLKRKLRFYFMNPIEKWQAKQRFPYKFIVQVVKLVLVTFQLYLFAQRRYTHVNYVWDNKVTFSNLFLNGWDASREISVYPPGIGPLAIYKIDDFYQTIDYAVKNYCILEEAIGPYSYTEGNNSVANVQLCLSHYKEGEIFGFNESYVFNSQVIVNCETFNLTSVSCGNFSSFSILEARNSTVVFSAFLRGTLSFGIKTVNLKSAGPLTPPSCYKFNVSIVFDNEDMDGQTLLSLDAEASWLECNGDTDYQNDNRLDSFLRSLLNSLVIIICLISLSLCARTIYRAQLLKKEIVNYFRQVYNKDLSVEGKLEFLNMWFVLIIINDILIIMGSSLKEQIERNQLAGDEWDICSVLLGIGNLLVWFGVLRYLGFFKTYNVVILTLKRAMPKVLRFMICAVIIYAGFTFCGWLILGPYHIKFRTLATTSECLFALINGDDMFATFSILECKQSSMLWWFSRLYLYIFITLYIYVVLSLFISVIMDAYDTIKSYYVHGFPKNDVQEFMSSSSTEQVTFVKSDSSSSLGDCLDSFTMGAKITMNSFMCRTCCKSQELSEDQAEIM